MSSFEECEYAARSEIHREATPRIKHYTFEGTPLDFDGRRLNLPQQGPFVGPLTEEEIRFEKYMEEAGCAFWEES